MSEPIVKEFPQLALATIKTDDAYILICMRCTETKNVYLHRTPTDDALKTGTIQYPMFRYCKCDAAVRKESQLLADIDMALRSGVYETVEEVQRYIRQMASREEMREEVKR
jgi:hypothetical protein